MTDYWRENLKKFRVAKKLTQEVLAELAGIDQSQISHLEKGGRNFTQETLDKLLPHLGANYSDLFSINPSAGNPEIELSHREMLDDKKKIISMLEKVSLLEKENQELKEHINQKALYLERIKVANLQKRPGDPEGFDPMSERCQAFAIFKEES